MMNSRGWVGYDLDGTLADDSTAEFPAIGNPVPLMIARLKKDLRLGLEVRVFTARASHEDTVVRDMHIRIIEAWCLRHIGQKLPVTCKKDFNMIRCYDDRAWHVVPNTGQVIE